MRKMTLSPKGAEFIKGFEAFREDAYKPVKTEKYYTIGWGHYGPDVKADMTVTEEEAEALFRGDVQPIEELLNVLGINFRQECFDAITSFVFNLGAGNFRNSTLLAKITSDAKDEDITDQMVRWVNAGGKPLVGLKKRRIAEANMFLGRDAYYLDEKNNIKKR